MSNKTIKNSFFSLVYQITTLFFALVIRKVFLIAFGVEYLGIINTFTSLIGALSLAELGFETSFLYRLYKPLVEGNTKLISKIMNLFRTIYSKIAIAIGVIVCIFSIFLRVIYKDVSFTVEIYIWYFLLGLDAVLSYLMAYKRTLLFADQKDFWAKRIDLGAIIVCSIARIVFLLLIKSVPLYIFVQIIQTVGSNLLVSIVCKKNYSFIKKDPIDKALLKEILSDVKNVFASRISYFVNTTSDVLLTSVLVGTATVGFFTNYSTIINALKRIIVSIIKPVSPFIGTLLADKSKSQEDKRKMLNTYMMISFYICMILLIPAVCLIDDFMDILYGTQFRLSSSISLFMCLNVFFVIMQRGTADFVNGAGLFKIDKYIEIFGALINIIFSILLGIRYELLGILIGTFISNIFFILGRGYIVYKSCLKCDFKNIFEYTVMNLFYVLLYIGSSYLVRFLNHFIHFKIKIVDFLCKGIINVFIAIVICFVSTIFFPFTKELLVEIKYKLIRRGKQT